MASSVTNSYKGRALGDNAQISTAIDLEANTIRLMLLTSSHTPNDDTDVFISQVNSNEISTTGNYTAGLSGGAVLAVTCTTDDATNDGIFDATDVVFTSATITCQYAVIYKDTGNASTSPIVCTIDFLSNQSTTGGTFTIVFSSTGIINLG